MSGVLVNVIGRLGNKPEMKVSPKGTEFATFNLAVDEFNKGNRETTWFTVADFTPNAKKRAEILNKGSLVHVIGREKVRLYQDKDNNTRIARDIQVSFIDFVSGGSKQEQQTTEVNCGVLQESQPMQQPQTLQRSVQQQVVNPQSTGAPIPPQPQTVAQAQQMYQQPVQQAATATAGGYDDDLPF